MVVDCVEPLGGQNTVSESPEDWISSYLTYYRHEE